MKTVGIIAEYNPFHTGHQYQIQYIKNELNADYIVIAMSGDFVQRGTPAIFPKHARAEMALRAGADLVLELPVSVSTASAEFFAGGAVNLLSELGVIHTLCFGCECDELPLFQLTADILLKEPEYYRFALQSSLKCGKSFPAARSDALIAYFDKYYSDESYSNLSSFFSSPNNILGIEYCKALLREKSSIIPHPLKRTGASYHELEISEVSYPSASGIRHSLGLIRQQEQSDALLDNLIHTSIPDCSSDIFRKILMEYGIVTERHLDSILQYQLLSESVDSLMKYQDITEELARRIINMRNQYQNFVQFTELLKTKELTYTRIQRALLHIVLRIYHTTVKIPYARILGFRKNSGSLLKQIKKNASIPLITKLSDVEKKLDPSALALLAENTFSSNLYESFIQHQTGHSFHHEYTKPVVIL